MEEYRNIELFGVNSIWVRAVDGKQEIYLEWPKLQLPSTRFHLVLPSPDPNHD